MGLMTPKQVARSLVKYGKNHTELDMSAFIILQVPGSIPRSHPVDGVSESLVKSKKYLLPLVVLSPEFVGAVAAGYLAEGRLRLPENATIFEVGDEERIEGGDPHASATSTRDLSSLHRAPIGSRKQAEPK